MAYVYLLGSWYSNGSIVFKIGRTKHSVKRRLLGATTMNPNEIYEYATIEVNNDKELESWFHKKYKDKRIPNKKEWFEIDLQTVKLDFQLAEILGAKIKWNDVNVNDKNKNHFPWVKRSSLGVGSNQTLYFFYKGECYESIVAINIDDKKIKYKDEKPTSLSSLTKKIFKENFNKTINNINGNNYWTIDKKITLAQMAKNKGFRKTN